MQHANLGDGAGWRPQQFEYRSLLYPGSPGLWIGSCWESLAGGNHFRVWKQQGTGAWFLAVSEERSVAHKHTIAHDGYDRGRDHVVRAAVHRGAVGVHPWTTSVAYVAEALPLGARGTWPGLPAINHNISIDGRVAVLTVRRTTHVFP